MRSSLSAHPSSNRIETGAAASVTRLLVRIRRRLALWVFEAVAARWFTVTGIILLFAVGLAPVANNAMRVMLVGLWLAGTLATTWALRCWFRPLRDERRLARYLQQAVPGNREDFELATALERQSFDDPDSLQMVANHRASVLRRLTSLPPSTWRAPRDWRFDTLALVSLVVMLAAAIFAPNWSAGLLRRWLAWDVGVGLEGTSPRETALLAEFEFVIKPPAYTRLESERLAGNGELLRAYKGSVVDVAVRLRDPAHAVRLDLPGSAVAVLHGQGGRYSGSFVVVAAGPYSLSVNPGAGWITDKLQRRIEILADQPPQVRLLAPTDGVVVQPTADIVLRCEALDDFGFTKAAVVVDAGAGEKRFALPTSTDVSHSVISKAFAAAEWESRPGVPIRYYVEIYDNDTISGPKRGTSVTQTLEIYSPHKLHRELLDRQDKLFDVVIHALGDAIELPERYGEGALGRLATLHLRLRDAAAEFTTLLNAFRSDSVANPASLATLESLAQRTKMLANETSKYAEAASRGVEPGRYETYRVQTIVSLESIAISFVEIIQRDRMNDLLVTAQDLEAAREELRRMIENYKAHPDPAKLEALKNKIAEIQSLMEQLARQQLAMSRSLPDEFLNADAFAKAQAANPAGKLDDLKKLLETGDPARVLSAIEKFEQSLGEMLAQLGRAGEQVNLAANAEPYRELSRMLDELTEIEAGQKRLAEEARQQHKRALQDSERAAGEAKSRLADQAAELQKRTRELLDKALMSPMWGQGFGSYGQQAHAEAMRAKVAIERGDWQGARETLRRAEGYLRSMQSLAQFEHQAGIGGKLSGELERDAATTGAQAARLREAIERLAAPSTPGDENRMQQLAEAQRRLEERVQRLRERMQPGSQAPVPEASRKALDDGRQAMGQARSKMESNQVPDAALKADEAAEKIGQARGELAKAKERMEQQGRGQAVWRVQGQGRGVVDKSERVEIPHIREQHAERREEVLKGLREGLPKAYEDLNKKYYERLVK